ncbi:ABC-2 type transporter-domain-containing protein [Apiospora saccharicola]
MQSFIDFLFSIFLLSQLFSTLDQQIIPRLADGRSLFDAREKRSKSYLWTVFLAANITVASVIVFATWYYLTGLWQNGNGDPAFGMVERGGLVFCGVLVQPDDLLRFWIFVYRASPLTYFIDGMVVASLANTRIRCSAVQLLHIDIPRGSPATTTCGSYLGPFLRYAGGYVENPEATATERCLYCPVDRTNHLLLRFGIHAEQSAWQNVGYMSVYVVFNVLATYLIYWLARVPKRTGRERT